MISEFPKLQRLHYTKVHWNLGFFELDYDCYLGEAEEISCEFNWTKSIDFPLTLCNILFGSQPLHIHREFQPRMKKIDNKLIGACFSYENVLHAVF